MKIIYLELVFYNRFVTVMKMLFHILIEEYAIIKQYTVTKNLTEVNTEVKRQ